MKAIRLKRISSLVIPLLLFCTSCLEVEVSTEVKPDGSIVRTIITEGDSLSIFESHFPIPKDTTWEITLEMSRDDSGNATDNLIYTARKQYESYRDVNQDFQITDPNQVGINIDLSVKKRFRWFFTVLEYREQYRVNNPIDAVPLSDYLKEGEIDLWLRVSRDEEELVDSSETAAAEVIDEKINQWVYQNRYEAFYGLIYDTAQRFGGDVISPMTVEAGRDSLQARFEDDWPYYVDELIELFGAILGEEQVNRLVELNPEPFDVFQEQVDFFDEMTEDTYINEVTMPGIIVDSNARSVEGNTVTWEDITYLFIFYDVNMQVTSRHLNWWMIGISAVVVLVLAAGLVLSALRFRQHPQTATEAPA